MGVLDVLSLFEEGLNPALIYTYTVTAIDSEGNKTTASNSVTTGECQPPSSGTPEALTGLRAAVYSTTAAELLWDRPEIFGLSYEVQRDGEVVSQTNGTSYFDDSLVGGLSFQYDIVVIDQVGNRSTASTITVRTE